MRFAGWVVAALVVAGVSLLQPHDAAANECRAACQVARASCLHEAATAKTVCREQCAAVESLDEPSPRGCRKACLRAFGAARKSCHKAVAGCVEVCTDGHADAGCMAGCRAELVECGVVFRECAGECRIDEGPVSGDGPQSEPARPTSPDGGSGPGE